MTCGDEMLTSAKLCWNDVDDGNFCRKDAPPFFGKNSHKTERHKSGKNIVQRTIVVQTFAKNRLLDHS